jgi:segregation and condensation protein A
MSDILSTLRTSAFLEFSQLFRAEEGRMGVTVTFSAILELMKEGLIEIVQAEPYAPLHVRPTAGSRHLVVVDDDEREESTADAENEAALAQPAQPDENDIDDEEDDLLLDEASETAAETGVSDVTDAQETVPSSVTDPASAEVAREAADEQSRLDPHATVPENAPAQVSADEKTAAEHDADAAPPEGEIRH